MTSFNSYTAPDFNLLDISGKNIILDDFSGKWLVLYFYPKDDTPGCTIEACSLRDVRDDLTELGAVVIGISRDDAKSHDLFKTKYNLNFNLLSDPDHKVMDSYGAWGKKAFGQEGVLRKTFIINPEGRVVKIFDKVTPLGHGKTIVNNLKILQNQYNS